MHGQIIDCYFNVFFVEIQLTKQNLKSDIWASEFGHPNRYTGLPNSLYPSLLSASIFEETKLETKLAIKYSHQNILKPFICIIFIISIIYLESSKNVFFCNWTITLTYWFICKVNDHGQKFVAFWKSQKRLFLDNSKYLLNK